MRYIDSGFRDREHALATWMERALSPDVVELRWQAGYFVAESLGLLASTIERLTLNNQLTRVLVGSNDDGTLGDDVRRLAELTNVPRTNGDLAVVNYANAFYHAKTYHLRRGDGSQWAYVGSANLTPPGLTGLNVEAGIVLDTRDGDAADRLEEIAAAVDAWFTTTRDGFNLITSAADIDRLVSEGILLAAPVPRSPAAPGVGGGGGENGTARPRLRPLVGLPALPGRAPAVAAPAPAPTPPAPLAPAAPPVITPAAAPTIAVETRPEFPAHVLCAPGATGPTVGVQALSGRVLPNGAVGAVVRASGDTARIFNDEVGTANMSIPTNAVVTLRFGIQGKGRYPTRPRAEFDLLVRYLGQQTHIVHPDVEESNVMPYGYLPRERGNRDIRMLIPAPVRALGERIHQTGLRVPAETDFTFLEWPTPANPEFRLSFLEPGSVWARQAQQLFASAAGQMVLGDNACALPPGISPNW